MQKLFLLFLALLVAPATTSFAQTCPADPNQNAPFTCNAAPVRINTFAPAGTGLYSQFWFGNDDRGGAGGAGTADAASQWPTAFTGGGDRNATTCAGLPVHANAPTQIIASAPTLGVSDAPAGDYPFLPNAGNPAGRENAQQDGWLLVPVGVTCVDFVIGGPFADANALYAGEGCTAMELVGEVNLNDGAGDNNIMVAYDLPANLPTITTTQNGCEFQLLRIRLYHHDGNAASSSVVQSNVTGVMMPVPTAYLLPAANANDDTPPTVLDDVADETLYGLIDENGNLWEPNGNMVPTARINAGSCFEITSLDDCAGQPAPSSGPTCADALAADPCQITIFEFGCECDDPSNIFATPGDPTSVTAYRQQIVVASGIFTGNNISVANVTGATNVNVVPTPDGEGIANINFMAAPGVPYSFDIEGSDGTNSLVVPVQGQCGDPSDPCSCPAKPEVCGDGIDNDLDGDIDAADADIAGNCQLDCDATPVEIIGFMPDVDGRVTTQFWTRRTNPVNCCNLPRGTINPSPLGTTAPANPFTATDGLGLPEHINGAAGTITMGPRAGQSATNDLLSTLGVREGQAVPNSIMTKGFADQAQVDAWIAVPASVECLELKVNNPGAYDGSALYLGSNVSNLELVGASYGDRSYTHDVGPGATNQNGAIFTYDITAEPDAAVATIMDAGVVKFNILRARVYVYDARVFNVTPVQWNIGNGFTDIPAKFLQSVGNDAASTDTDANIPTGVMPIAPFCAYQDADGDLFLQNGDFYALNTQRCEQIMDNACLSCPENLTACVDDCEVDVVDNNGMPVEAAPMCDLEVFRITPREIANSPGTLLTTFWDFNDGNGFIPNGTNPPITNAFSVFTEGSCPGCLPQHPNFANPTGVYQSSTLGVADAALPDGDADGVNPTLASPLGGDNAQQDGFLIIPAGIECVRFRLGQQQAWDASRLYLGNTIDQMTMVGENTNPRGGNPTDAFFYNIPADAPTLTTDCGEPVRYQRLRLYHHDNGVRSNTIVQWNLGNGFVNVPARFLRPVADQCDDTPPTPPTLTNGTPFLVVQDGNGEYFSYSDFPAGKNATNLDPMTMLLDENVERIFVNGCSIIEPICNTNLDNLDTKNVCGICIKPGLAKTIANVSNAASGIAGNVDVTYKYTLTNAGNATMNNLVINDNIASLAGYVGIITTPVVTMTSPMATAPTANGGYVGTGNLLNGTSGALVGGQQTMVTVVAEFDASMIANTEVNQAQGGNDVVLDDSDSGINPDPTNPNTGEPGDDGATNNGTPTYFPSVSSTKAIVDSRQAISGISGNLDVTYQVVICNTGNINLQNIILSDTIGADNNLRNIFVGVVEQPTITNSDATTDPTPTTTFDGEATMPQLLSGGGNLAPGQCVTVQFIAEIDPNAEADLRSNQGKVNAEGVRPDNGMTLNDPNGNPIMVMDLTDSGLDPLTQNPGAPGDTGGSDDATVLEVADFAIAKSIVGVDCATSGGEDNYDAIFEVVVENTGNVNLTDFTLTDQMDLATMLGTAFVAVTEAPMYVPASVLDTILTDATTNPTLNADFDGTMNEPVLITGGGLLEPGQRIVLRFRVEVDPDAVGAPANPVNQLNGTANGTRFGNPVTVTDLSDSGRVPESENPDAPGDMGTSSDPTPLNACQEAASDSQVLGCNDELNISLNSDCSGTLSLDALAENVEGLDGCTSNELYPLGGFYRITISDELGNVIADADLSTANDFDLDGIAAGTRLQYSIQNVVTKTRCWGELNIEDKSAPLCAPAGEEEALINYDIDCDNAIENFVNDPSGVDDLADEYILCSLIEQNGFDIYFDELEARDAAFDLDGDGIPPYNADGSVRDADDLVADCDGDGINESSVCGDFIDCTGIESIFFRDEVIDVCELDDLQNISIDETKYDITAFEVTTVYRRTWFAIDLQGFTSEQGCTQQVFAIRPKVNTIELPQEVEIDCSEDIASVTRLSAPRYSVGGRVFNNGTGSDGPQAFDTDNNNQTPAIAAATKLYYLEAGTHTCKYATSYHEDPIIDICTGSTKQTRHWSVLDWCDGGRAYSDFTQLIKVTDNTAPTLISENGFPLFVDGAGVTRENRGNGNTPAYTIDRNIQVFECEADGNLPDVRLVDDCSLTEFSRVTLERVEDDNTHDVGNVFVNNFLDSQPINGSLAALSLPKGDYIVTYFFMDDCGNANEIEVPLFFEDKRVPQPICNDELIVTLIASDVPGDQRARVYPEDLDDTSRDGCFPLAYEVRLGDGSNQPWGPFVEFDCSHVIAEDEEPSIRVELRVSEDRNNNGRVDVGELSNFCWTYIRIEDKTPPIISVNNGEFVCNDPELNVLQLNQGTYQPGGENTDALFPTILGGCTTDGIVIDLLEVDARAYDPVCKIGTFVRRFRAVRNIHGNEFPSPEVTQTIDVLYNSDWTMEFPADILVECDDNADSNLDNVPAPLRVEDIITNRGCDQWGMEVEDEIFDVIGQDGDGACFKIIRTYKFINWCTWDPTNTEEGVVIRPLEFFTNPLLSVTLDYRSASVLNLCDLQNDIDDRFERSNDPYDVKIGNDGDNVAEFDDAAGLYETDADWIYFDEEAFGAGTANVFNGGDCIEADFNALTQSFVDAPSASTPANSLIDDQQLHTFVSAEAYGYFIYRQIIKVNDSQAPIVGEIDDFVVCDSTNVNGNCTANVIFPIPSVIECKPTYDINWELYAFNTATVSLSGQLGDDNAGNFTPLALNNIPYGTHRLRYIVADGCGNSAVTDFEFTVQDCKAPTAYCRTGVILELMPTGMVAVWASDLDAGSFDDCSQPVSVSFSPNPVDTGLVFTCDQRGTNFVQLWVTDAVGNQSVCETLIIIQSNDDNECATGAVIAGAIETEMGEAVENTEVRLSGATDVAFTTEVDGSFGFTSLVEGADYTITPEKDVNYLNGVSTFDLVVIRKHILGLENLSSPYRMIAADINNSSTITTLDMVQLRRVILGIDSEFTNNTSWRFVAADYAFPNPVDPWMETFPEVVNFNDLAIADNRADFVAIKVGDVNNSATPNTLLGTDERNADAALVFDVTDAYATKGETVTIDFTAEVLEVEGYQFTLDFDPEVLELVEVVEGVAKAEHFGTTLITEGVITTSFNGEVTTDVPLFSLTFTALTNVQLSEAITVSSAVTPAEAYRNNEVLDIQLDFGSTTTSIGYELYQNTPNPFYGKTSIGFNLPTATTAKLTIRDVNGKTLSVIQDNFAAGMHQVELDETTLNHTTAILYYTLETAEFTATRKMIVIQD